MKFAKVLGMAALAAPFAMPLAGQQVAPASLTAATACTGPFTQVPSPSPSSTENVLLAAAAAGTTSEWAVGRQLTPSGYQNLILFNGGHGWSQIPAPNPGIPSDELTSASASGPSDAWAAGFNGTGNPAAPNAPQALHWDGTAWTQVPLPTLPGGGLDPDFGPGVVDISPTDAWLAGTVLTATATKSFIAHWDGTTWSLVSHPPAPALEGIAASGPHDVWAIGTGTGPSFPAVIEHYNGSKWTMSATLPGINLSGVTSISPAQAWAVGTSQGTITTTATAEWNGTDWHTVPSPNPSTQGDRLDAVSAVAGGGVWAIGSEVNISTGGGEIQPMAMHWDGTAWTAIPAIGTGGVDPEGGGSGDFLGVAAVTPSHVIVVGFGPRAANSLVAHLCTVRVRDSGFAPPAAQLTGPGSAAYWVIPASDTASHRLTDGSGFGLFDSGTKPPGSSYAFPFPASGTWPVTDRATGAHQTIGVPILTIVTGIPHRPTLWLATAPPPAGSHFEIQDIPPGGTTFVHFVTTVKTTWRLTRSLPPGTYKFRSRLRNPTTGAATKWSPTLTITLP